MYNTKLGVIGCFVLPFLIYVFRCMKFISVGTTCKYVINWLNLLLFLIPTHAQQLVIIQWMDSCILTRIIQSLYYAPACRYINLTLPPDFHPLYRGTIQGPLYVELVLQNYVQWFILHQTHIYVHRFKTDKKEFG